MYANLLYHSFQNTDLAMITDCSNFVIGGVVQEISACGSNLFGFFSRKFHLYSTINILLGIVFGIICNPIFLKNVGGSCICVIRGS